MTRNRNLFIAAGIFHPESGGPATYLYEILPELQRRGWSIRAVTYGEGNASAYPYPLTRIPRRALPLRLMHYGAAAFPLLRWADVVYVHTLDLPLAGGRAPRIVKIVGDQAWERAIRKGWIPATEDIDDFQTRPASGIVAAQQTARSRQVRAMQGVIVPSAYLKRMVVGWGVPEARVHVIYNALPPEPSGAAGDAPLLSISQAEARTRLNLPDVPTLVTAARLTPWKGVDHLVAALRQVPDVHLLVAGEGEMRPALEQQVARSGLAGRVHFLGRIDRARLALYFRAADYLALYSGYEGLSHTLLEALQAGTPVIASDKGGNPEVVQNGVNGLLVPYINVEALAAALVDAFKPGMRARLAANHAIGMERFSFPRMVEATDALLRGYAGG